MLITSKHQLADDLLKVGNYLEATHLLTGHRLATTKQKLMTVHRLATTKQKLMTGHRLATTEQS